MFSAIDQSTMAILEKRVEDTLRAVQNGVNVILVPEDHNLMKWRPNIYLPLIDFILSNIPHFGLGLEHVPTDYATEFSPEEFEKALKQSEIRFNFYHPLCNIVRDAAKRGTKVFSINDGTRSPQIRAERILKYVTGGPVVAILGEHHAGLNEESILEYLKKPANYTQIEIVDLILPTPSDH